MDSIVTTGTSNEAGTAQPQITMYTTQWCGDCRMAKRHLAQRGFTYDEIDIEEVPGAAEQVMAWARGYRTVPTFVIGKRVVVDWNPREFEAAVAAELAEAGER